MIRHVVMWNVRGESRTERETGAKLVQNAFQTLQGEIPGMRSLEVGINAIAGDDMCDVVLIADFDSEAALKGYAVHPRHLGVRDELAGIRTSRHCVDFEVHGG